MELIVLAVVIAILFIIGKNYKTEEFKNTIEDFKNSLLVEFFMKNEFSKIEISKNEVENYYWTFFSLWKSKFFHRFLCGSVIDMLRITDLKKILIEKVQPNFENFEKNEILIERLKTVEKLNSEYSRRVQVLEKLRHQLIYHFYFVK